MANVNTNVKRNTEEAAENSQIQWKLDISQIRPDNNVFIFTW